MDDRDAGHVREQLPHRPHPVEVALDAEDRGARGAPVASQASPTPYPVPVSATEEAPPASTRSRRPCSGRQEKGKPCRSASSTALATSGGRSSPR
ncbi:hypothetical protein [Streptosporangium saharense]|uniref:hypothetical protein n=1 Tax=Streptosporangium saharense TaxID=1706840 RepID=UPI0036C1E0C3